MNWIVTHIRWIMVVSGALTCTMLYAAVAPESVARQGGVVIVIDLVMVALFIGYLVGVHRDPTRGAR